MLGASLASAMLAEFINWVMIYRTDVYKQMKDDVSKLQKLGNPFFSSHFLSSLLG